MKKWTKSFFKKRRTEISSSNMGQDSDLLGQFELFLADRMKEFFPNVKDAFANLLAADLPDSVKGLHIEVFLDVPAFSFRIFGKENSDVWAGEPEPVKEFNNAIERLWPIVTQDELDQYTIWEDDPKWGRQVALEQPLDELNVPGIVLPWFKKMVSETKGNFTQSITASVHDITLPEEL